jgi:hypothetical protein
MITHIVLFRPRASLSADERQAVSSSLASLVKNCPEIRACRVGQRIRHGLPGYEQAMREDFEYALLLDFDTVEGLKQYLQHPRHTALGQFFTEGAAASLAYDFEMTPVGMSASV